MAKKNKRHGECRVCGGRGALTEEGTLALHADARGKPCDGSHRPPETKEERDRRISGAVRDRLSSFFGWKP